MGDDEDYLICIYWLSSGAVIEARGVGRVRFLRERAFLDDLVAETFGRLDPDRPAPDPSTDLYVLDDAQLDAYSAFRKRLMAEEDQSSDRA